MESGPSVLAVFTGVTEAVIVLEALLPCDGAVLEFGELPHAAATKPTAIAAAAET
jgi:hypothetical protein